jgi:succinate dehydrogenase / fumarate reductase, flavoprotein subunit
MMRQVDTGQVKLFPREEMLDLVVADGKARGIITRNLINGEIERHEAHAVLLCTGGYGNVYYLSTNAKNSNATAIWRCHKRGPHSAIPATRKFIRHAFLSREIINRNSR